MSNKDNIILYKKNIKNSYKILKNFTAGLVLKGWEVRSLRNKKINISSSYISFIKNEIFLFNSIFTPNKNINININNFKRNRKLLLNKHEINYLYNKVNKKKYKILIIYIFWKNNLCKIRISIVKNNCFFKNDKRSKIINKIFHKEKFLF